MAAVSGRVGAASTEPGSHVAVEALQPACPAMAVGS